MWFGMPPWPCDSRESGVGAAIERVDRSGGYGLTVERGGFGIRVPSRGQTLRVPARVVMLGPPYPLISPMSRVRI